MALTLPGYSPFGATPMSGVAPGYLWQFLGPVGQPGVPFRPFPAQFEALNTVKLPWPGIQIEGNRRVPYPTIFGINCGRRFGKTTIAEVMAWQAIFAPNDMFGPPCVRITADTFEHGLKIFDRFVWHAENTDLKIFVKRFNKSRYLIEFTNGATLQLLSAENPQALAGDGVTCWLVDEAQYLSYPAWENLFPSTAERDGVIIMFGVAEGEGPFREICYKGDNRRDNPEYLRLCYPTSSNPFVPRWRIEFARRQYSPTKFKQLYLAEWADDTGKIIKNARGCVNNDMPTSHPQGWGQVHPYVPGQVYYGGLDLALHADWCVFTIADKYGRLVAWDRFNRGSWELLKARVFRLSQAYNHPLTHVDSTGSGDPIYEDLQRMGMRVSGFKISTNEKKRQLIDELAIRIGAGNLSYPDIKLMLQELELFEASRSKSGVIQYSAPAGMHDDFVVALALMCQGTPRPTSPIYLDRIMSDPSLTMDDEELAGFTRTEILQLREKGVDLGHLNNPNRGFSEADWI